VAGELFSLMLSETIRAELSGVLVQSCL